MTSRTVPAPEFAAGQSADRLVAVLGRRCRHVTAVVGPDALTWQHALARHAGDVVKTPGASGDPAGRRQFKTVIAANASRAVTLEEMTTLATEAWPLVAPGGRLLVVAANGDAQRPRGPIGMRDLRRRLRALAPPTFMGDQPFAWIVAELRKRRAGVRPPTARLDRYETTVRLCTGRVIELGCGPGDLAGMLHERGHDVVGVDMNAGKIAEARRRYPGVEFLQSDILSIAHPDASFDTAVLAEVLEHVPEPVGDRMLDRAWRLLRPGGRLIVSVPHEGFVPHRNHIREFSVRSLLHLLQRFGKPVLSVDQPFKWLLVHVVKP